MAKAKQFTPSEEVLALINLTKPASPVMTFKEKVYFKGLKKRGFSEEQINTFINKAGYKVPANFFVVKHKKTKSIAQPVAAQEPTR
jgi:hypothetical protein